MKYAFDYKNILFKKSIYLVALFLVAIVNIYNVGKYLGAINDCTQTARPKTLMNDKEKFDFISNATNRAKEILENCTVEKGIFRGTGPIMFGTDLDMEVFRMLTDSPPLSHESHQCTESLQEQSIIHTSICRHRFLWLGGLHFSGTSLMNYIINTFEDISGHTNTGSPMDEGQHLQREFPRDFHFGNTCLNPNSHPGYHMDEHHEFATDKARACIYSEWAKYWDLSKPVLLEKTPLSLLHLRYRQWLFPGVSASIIVVRHPLYGCVIHPNKRNAKNFFNEEVIESALYHWFESHKYLVSNLPELEKYAIIMFEDFFTKDDPIDEIEFIVSSFFPDVLSSNDNKTIPEIGRRRLPFRSKKGVPVTAPEINKGLIMSWTERWERLLKVDMKDDYEKILPTLMKYEKEVNEYGYSLLDVNQINSTAFEKKFGRKYQP